MKKRTLLLINAALFGFGSPFGALDSVELMIVFMGLSITFLLLWVAIDSNNSDIEIRRIK